MATKGQLTAADPLDYSEYQRLVRCLHEDKLYFWEMYARLAFCTACRCSDVRRMRWCDVLGKREIVVTEKKTGKTRAIPVSQRNIAIFRHLYELMGKPALGDYIFVPERCDKPIAIQNINAMLKLFKARYHLRIGHFSSHTFRKTFGRYVYDSMNHGPESLILLCEILNHSSIETTKRYIGIRNEEIANVFLGL